MFMDDAGWAMQLDAMSSNRVMPVTAVCTNNSTKRDTKGEEQMHSKFLWWLTEAELTKEV